MTDANEVPRLIEGLYQKFLPPTMVFFRRVLNSGPGRKEDQKIGDRMIEAGWTRPFLQRFLFVWLTELEHFSQWWPEMALRHTESEIQKGGIRRNFLADDMMPYGGQTIYEWFTRGFLKGPYAMPWNNAEATRMILRKVRASLPKGRVLPEEAEKLLALRGVRIVEKPKK